VGVEYEYASCGADAGAGAGGHGVVGKVVCMQLGCVEKRKVSRLSTSFHLL
jgi:hypothetical protein